ncbi:GAPM1a [Besnoitia besnoiti]|uniref:GAPM1a n=1 Tax=Besnoitia besnoiti TaxID=94643 RepID=A0A2A9MG52_BESBE|nr:GAPM1a [Besnoitia besnoiti]PFH34633.1 GAPM1a [Besnoitia besnoiti]
MYFTYVVRPGEAPEGRGPQLEPFWNFMVNYNLRFGLLLQLAAYVGLLLTISAGGNDSLTLLSFFRASPEAVGQSPVWTVQICCGLFILGSLMTMAFQSLVDDDSSIKQSRGYRSGTKFLQFGSSLAVFGWILTLLVFYAANYYFDDPWMQKQLGAGSTWITFFTARLCDAFSLVFLGAATFFLEVYHSEGAGEAWGWFCAICFKLTALTEVIGLTAFGSENFKVVDAIFTIMLGVSLSLGLVWALIFEPVSHRFDVKSTQSAMRNEYYKSRNAMAYYGPAVVNADGEVDIAAAAEQAQACLACRG